MIYRPFAPALILAFTSAAAAAPFAHVDEVVIAGGIDPNQGRAFASLVTRRAGFEPRFADSLRTPCGDVPACLVDRAREVGAAVAIRITLVDVGGQVIASMLAIDARGRMRRQLVPGVDVYRADDTLAAELRLFAPQLAGRTRTAAWAFTVTSAALALAGGILTWHAHDRRAQFYADHVAANGDVVGISPADARARERIARQWSMVGGSLLGGAALSGITATILFVRTPSGDNYLAGVAVAVDLP
jgi:hypothetical protein